jgi:hypothetical protein
LGNEHDGQRDQGIDHPQRSRQRKASSTSAAGMASGGDQVMSSAKQVSCQISCIDCRFEDFGCGSVSKQWPLLSGQRFL